MKASFAITLQSFVTALGQLENLPLDKQRRLSEIGRRLADELEPENFLDDQLDIFAEDYPPLDELYQQVRQAIQGREKERTKGFPIPGQDTPPFASRTVSDIGTVQRILLAPDSVVAARFL